MTKKDYIKIAAALNVLYLDANEIKEVKLIGTITNILCEVFKKDNPRFDPEIFKGAVQYLNNTLDVDGYKKVLLDSQQ
jgi:hypothetical protein